MNNLPECCWYLQAECKCQCLWRSSFPLSPGAPVCFVFSQHFKVKPEKIKSWNHYWERSEHKYFIIWYFQCKNEFMHGLREYRNSSISTRPVQWWQENLAEFPNSDKTLGSDAWKKWKRCTSLESIVQLSCIILFTTWGRSIRFYTC